mmetsp:Transcript_146728/g.281336  ORF Transcript_146728/g.281336 Transcript_146728/m.281336 type:complete len:101 (-) Transcript_146728:111-413(-)
MYSKLLSSAPSVALKPRRLFSCAGPTLHFFEEIQRPVVKWLTRSHEMFLCPARGEIGLFLLSGDSNLDGGSVVDGVVTLSLGDPPVDASREASLPDVEDA